MTSVLVTGKDSQLGQCIQSLAPKFSNLKFVFKTSTELDITNQLQVNSIFKSSDKFDYCINCAAYTAVDKAENEIEKAFSINVDGVKNIAEACRNNKVTLIHVSTDFLFDGTSLKPYSEDCVTNPLGIYGKTKLKGEQEIERVLANYFIIRTSWLYSEYGNNFLKTMLRLSKERNEISIVDDQIGSPTYAKDLAEVILNLVNTKKISFGIYNYSNSGVVSWYDFANEIFKLSKSRTKLNSINTKDYPTTAERPKYSVLETSKIAKLLGLDIPNWKASLARAFINLEKKD
jgi:dTDP-4-dehydrorhamnose reductase